MTLADRVIIITGASSGIGAATAVECARAGMDVALVARRGDRLEEVAVKVRETGRRAAIVIADVAERGASTRILDAAEAELGRFDVVFANAGYSMRRAVLDETDDELRRMFDVNFFPGVELLREAARRLLDAGRGGHLLMCSSCVSKFSMPKHSTYCATKAAQNAVCGALRLELRDRGVNVSSVHPITTTTEFFETAARMAGEPAPDGTPKHAPRLFTQPPERVARAVVRCLRRPCPEVWTSHIVRTVAAVGTAFPRFGDWMIGRQTRKD